MVEEKAAVAMMEIEQTELDRVAKAFGYELVSTKRLTGGYASSNFAAVLKAPDGVELTAVLKFSYAAMPREEIEHQLAVLSVLEAHSFRTNYLLPRLGAAADATLCDRYLVTADDGGGPWVVLVTFMEGGPGDKMIGAASPQHERTMLESLGGALAELHAVPWEAAKLTTLRKISDGYPVCNTGELLRPGEVRRDPHQPKTTVLHGRFLHCIALVRLRQAKRSQLSPLTAPPAPAGGGGARTTCVTSVRRVPAATPRAIPRPLLGVCAADGLHPRRWLPRQRAIREQRRPHGARRLGGLVHRAVRARRGRLRFRRVLHRGE